MPESHPVITAIEEQRYQLGLRREKHQIEIDGIEAELEALAQAEKLVLAAADTDEEGDGELSPAPAEGDAPPTSPPPPAHPSPAAPSTASVDEKVLAALRSFDFPKGAGEIWRAVGTDFCANVTVSRSLKRLCEGGSARSSGKGSGTKYEIVSATTPVTPEAEHKAGSPPRGPGDQEPIVGGRILSLCQMPRTGPEIARELGIPLHDLRGRIGTLMRDGDLRLRREEGNAYYVTTG